LFSEKFLSSFSVLEGFHICTDLALCTTPTIAHCTNLLAQATNLLQRIEVSGTGTTGGGGGNNSSSGGGGNTSAATVNGFHRFLERLKVLQNYSADSGGEKKTCSQILTTMMQAIPFPQDPQELHALLTQRKAWQEARSDLSNLATKMRRAVEGYLADWIDPSSLDPLLRRIFGLFNNTSEGVHSGNHTSYLGWFLKHVLGVGEVLVRLENEKTRNYLLNLQEGPGAILSRLIFETKQYSKAENLASQLRIPLMSILLGHLYSPDFVESSVSAKSGGDPDSAKKDERQLSSSGGAPGSGSGSHRELFSRPLSLNANTKNHTHFSTSLPTTSTPASSPPTSSLGNNNKLSQSGGVWVSVPNDNNSETKYRTTMEVIEYVGKQQPMLAAIACMLRAPCDRIYGNFIDYALANVLVRFLLSLSFYFFSFACTFLMRD
jgi:hypothetical protein